MKAIWKFPLMVATHQEVEMPQGAEILTVQTQAGGPQVWALVETEAPYKARGIAIYGTGHPIMPQRQRYISTFQIDNGALVFHAFEITEAK